MNRRTLEEEFLTGTEDQIRLSISRLFNPPKNRILTEEQWWKKCVEIDNQILVAIEHERLPKELKISNFVSNYWGYILKKLVGKTDYISQFQEVSDYLANQEQKPDDVRYRDYGKTMSNVQ